ncbi:MAG: nucleotidyltransferase domain-containing protein [Armatimonadetes bacterium]|nr:nucleotidyltransferase domain-containing protein [Armatimonadota bacterium]
MRSVVQKRSYGSVEIFWLDSGEAMRRLRVAAGRLVAERSDVAAVYVFGSLPEGRAVPGSDADVLILLRESDRRWLDRPVEFAPHFADVGLPVDVFCYTVEEARANRMASHALARGVWLAGRTTTPV